MNHGSAYAYLLSEFVIILYGVFVNLYPNVPLIFQIYIRSVAFVVVALFLHTAVIGGSIVRSLILSAVNFVSIYGLYLGFKHLGIAISQSLFYTWTIFATVAYGVDLKNTLGVVIAFAIASALIDSTSHKDIESKTTTTTTTPSESKTTTTNPSESKTTTTPSESKTTTTPSESKTTTTTTTTTNPNAHLGYIGVAISIITHIAITLYYKTTLPNITHYLYDQYIGIFIVLSVVFIIYFVKRHYAKSEIHRTSLRMTVKSEIHPPQRVEDYVSIFAFNVLLGFVGFYARFHAMRSLSVPVISILTLVAVSFGVVIDRWMFHRPIRRVQVLYMFMLVVVSSFFL